jgi:hypothetical protein
VIGQILLVCFMVLVPAWLTALTYLYMRLGSRLEDVEKDCYER